ncbi:hypothetical protein PoB_004318300 [Plakobranchus ocellatus]|uniref:Uncharacterized protein n=1 Tax=Plakobranchus ocellatus TaxID=259542 RepID=A0AAV4BCR8_9GAST|nr:hypothetical protein PoB_004318300 [Plakobranchus ocellatus]
MRNESQGPGWNLCCKDTQRGRGRNRCFGWLSWGHWCTICTLHGVLGDTQLKVGARYTLTWFISQLQRLLDLSHLLKASGRSVLFHTLWLGYSQSPLVYFYFSKLLSKL